ncbi:MAG: RNA polymerase sigma factor [Chloroflexota bacterium]
MAGVAVITDNADSASAAGGAAPPACQPAAQIRNALPPGSEMPAEAPAYAELRRLAIAARTGDETARADLLVRLQPLAYGAAGRAASRAQRLGLTSTFSRDDLQQEAQIILLRLMETYDPAAGPPLPYFSVRLRIRLNQLLQAQARRRPPGRRVEWGSQTAQDLLAGLGARQYAEAEGLASAGVEAALYEALNALSPRRKRLLFLFYWRGLTDEDLAAVLRVSTEAAQGARYRALAALRFKLEAAGLRPYHGAR